MDYKSTTLFTRDERTLDFKRLAAEKIDLKGAPTPINESLVLDLNDIGFFTAPASVSYHGNKEGGLYDHSRAVADKLIDMTHELKLKWERPISPFIVGMFHDLCKCDQYIHMDGAYTYNDSLLLKEHGAKSIMILSQFMTLTEEEVMCIRYHMGAYQKDEWDELGRAIEKYPNVLWTHTADMVAARIMNK